ncbi:MAG: AAA family ATPase, partial [Chloroflexi bacterium]|nr:AAA family ATPase [Chloroflexota bacterium]
MGPLLPGAERPRLRAVRPGQGRPAEDASQRIFQAARAAGVPDRPQRRGPPAHHWPGEPGVGKNRVVYELARRTGKDLYIFQGHEDVTAEDLACAVRFSDYADRKMYYVVSPLVTALLWGGI